MRTLFAVRRIRPSKASEMGEVHRYLPRARKVKRTPLRRNPAKIREWQNRTRKPLPKTSRKAREWDRAKPRIDAAFLAAGITSCEVRLPGCTGGYALTRAHTRKRRNLKTGELTRIVMACRNCHEIVETWGEERMHTFLESIIESRTPEQKSALAKLL